jgi:low temperature requirement protein LtrA
VSEQRTERDHPVRPLELYFDLVFVFAFTQVTTLLSNDPTWTGLGQGLLILVALWWTWAGYAWLTNTVDPEVGAMLGAMLVATGAMFVAALAVPQTFGRHALIFGVAFLIVSLMHLALFALAGRGDKDLLAAVLRIAPSSLAGAALIIAAAFVDGWARALLWLVALAIAYIGSAFSGTAGWRLQPTHFVERHGLIVIIAIGESLVAIGLGARGTGLGAGVLVAAVLGFVVATSFWLAYFDFFQIRGRLLLEEREGAERTAIARDAFTYVHLPMIVGIIIFAFAMKETIAHVGDELGTIPALSLCGGSALYLFAYVALRLRLSAGVGRGRFTAGIACVLLYPVALAVPALVALALITVVWVALHAYEIIWWREARAETRALREPASAS